MNGEGPHIVGGLFFRARLSHSIHLLNEVPATILSSRIGKAAQDCMDFLNSYTIRCLNREPDIQNWHRCHCYHYPLRCLLIVGPVRC
jgi:hypothetical protein